MVLGSFARPHVVLPVIHVESTEQALRNASVAHEAGADGIFLINHGMSWDALLEIHHQVHRDLPDWWIGVNCLDLSPQQVFARLTPEVAGVWTDNAAIDERNERQAAAETIQRAREASGWQGLYFGGVAFKYQRKVEDLESAARTAASYMDVVTTSGPGTGQAAPLEKIAAMKRGLGDAALAIASGITPENVTAYLAVADCFLVATGISRSFIDFDPARVKALVDVVHAIPS